MSNPKRIDTHTHVTPDFWREALPSVGGDPSGWPTPTWTPDMCLAFMDECQIETSILSATAPGVNGWQGQAKLDMARRINEYVADLVQKNPARFGNFIIPPLPDVDAALKEVEYGFDKLKADGVVVLSNYNGVYLGDPSFESFWSEMNKRKAVVFIHPSKPQIDLIPGLLGPTLDYPFDTTRTAANLIQNGVVERNPDVKIILSHAGGMLPYVAYRYAVRGSELPENLMKGLQSFYYDLALSASPTVFPALFALVGADHITFGSDFNYAPPAKSKWFKNFLDNYNLTDEQRYAINRGTAETLFPRLKK